MSKKLDRKISCRWQIARRMCAIRNGANDPRKHAHPHVLPRQNWSFYVKRCRHK